MSCLASSRLVSPFAPPFPRARDRTTAPGSSLYVHACAPLLHSTPSRLPRPLHALRCRPHLHTLALHSSPPDRAPLAARPCHPLARTSFLLARPRAQEPVGAAWLDLAQGPPPAWLAASYITTPPAARLLTLSSSFAGRHLEGLSYLPSQASLYMQCTHHHHHHPVYSRLCIHPSPPHDTCPLLHQKSVSLMNSNASSPLC